MRHCGRQRSRDGASGAELPGREAAPCTTARFRWLPEAGCCSARLLKVRNYVADTSLANVPVGNRFQLGRVFRSWITLLIIAGKRAMLGNFAEAAWQPELEDTLRRVAQEFDEAAENIESGVAGAP
jgi:hypothetical protein